MLCIRKADNRIVIGNPKDQGASGCIGKGTHAFTPAFGLLKLYRLFFIILSCFTDQFFNMVEFQQIYPFSAAYPAKLYAKKPMPTSQGQDGGSIRRSIDEQERALPDGDLRLLSDKFVGKSRREEVCESDILYEIAKASFAHAQ